ncbi:hypothetical protein HBH64_168540 [Parastagonospora nodorum]|nr:hypothetical protein HBH49_190480 [Parastagonospora nodorum]KAH4293990.1 hypothetical protein HBI01_170330 [Parastagonospora nodorum]KAH4296678.1 hypothetical protein HBI02_169160 [Parastagonospora nodorum]KAH4325120.1 hypothetical protein HBI00_160950 [Parastagonospora nodorum]KAH4458502.1 hypothetical protein HBH90_156050 [Parastagonospora nodorum]
MQMRTVVNIIVIELVLRLALLLSSERTTDACRPAKQPNRQASRLLKSTLALMPHLYGETSSLNLFNPPFDRSRKRKHPRTLKSQARNPNGESPHSKALGLKTTFDYQQQARPPILRKVARRFNPFTFSSMRSGDGQGGINGELATQQLAKRSLAWCNDKSSDMAHHEKMAHSLRFPFLFVMQ